MLTATVYSVHIPNPSGEMGSAISVMTGNLAVRPELDKDGDGKAVVVADSPAAAARKALTGQTFVDTTGERVLDWLRRKTGNQNLQGQIDEFKFPGEADPNGRKAYRVEEERNNRVKVSLEDLTNYPAPPNDKDYNDFIYTAEVVRVRPDLVLQGLPEETTKRGPNELTPGGRIAVNADDDDDNQTADTADAGPVAGEDETVPVAIKLPAVVQDNNGGEVKLSVSNPGHVKVWAAASKAGQPVFGGAAADKSWPVADVPDELWVEGVQAGDANFKLEYRAKAADDWTEVDAANATVQDVKPILVGFYGANAPGPLNDGNVEMQRIGGDLSNAGFTQRTFDSRNYGGALGWLLGQLDTNDDGKYDPRRGGDLKREVRIYGHSWGGVSSVLLSRRVGTDKRFADHKVETLATIDPVNIFRDDEGGVAGNVKRFWNRYATKTDAPDKVVINVLFGKIEPHGYRVTARSKDGGNDQIDLNPTGTLTTLRDPKAPNQATNINHFNIINEVEADLKALLTR